MRNKKIRKVWVIAMRFRRTSLTLVIGLFVVVSYRLLFATDLGGEIAAMIGTLIQSELGAIQMKLQGYTLYQVFKRMVISDILNGAFDFLLVTVILANKRTRRLVEIFSEHFNKVWYELTHYWKSSKKKNANGVANGFRHIQSRVEYYTNNPQKVGIKLLFVCGFLPRIPPLPGGLATGIMVIRYNKYGIVHWLALAFGVLVRHITTLILVFDVDSFFK